MNIVPVFDRVLVKRLDRQEKVGEIYLPEKEGVNAQTFHAVVVAVGPDCQEVAVNDTVLVLKTAGTVVKHGVESYMLFAEKDILGLISNQP